MTIDDSRFGSITVDGKTYEHDVIIRLSGDIEKRKKKLSKEKYGTSHIISKDEAKFVYEDGCEIVIVGTGQQDNVRLSPEASEYLSKKVATSCSSRRLKPFIRSTRHARERSASCM
ncbi:MTH938/NDUFAF3 family protein [Methylocystis sp. IM4]|uniref:MTH938/NDUFAF3 family protein n=1 Tax=Methylocystis sp. IM4 TaxID=3136560 RepID=UPI003119CEA3